MFGVNWFRFFLFEKMRFVILFDRHQTSIEDICSSEAIIGVQRRTAYGPVDEVVSEWLNELTCNLSLTAGNDARQRVDDVLVTCLSLQVTLLARLNSSPLVTDRVSTSVRLSVSTFNF